MAGYSTTNPPVVTVPSLNGQIPNQWAYKSPVDSAATVAGAGYFTNALLLGMLVGDMVWVYDVTNTIVKLHQVLSFTGNAANLSAGTTVGAAS